MERIALIRNITALCALLLVAAPQASSGQDLKEAEELTAKVTQLHDAGKFAEALPLAQRALSLREQALGPNHADVASSLENLATLYSAQGRYADVEPLLERSVTIRESVLGPDDPSLAPPLNDLAFVFSRQQRYSEAEVLYQHALLIIEKKQAILPT